MCERLDRMEEELAAQLVDSYSGIGPVAFWTAVERFKLFLEMKDTLCG